MDPSTSTAVSDFVLAGTAAWSFFQINVTTGIDYQFSKWWFILQIIAAMLGVIKFGRLMEGYQEQVDSYHKKFSWLSLTLGIPCLGAQFCLMYGFTLLSQVFLGSAVFSFIVCTRKPNLKEKVSTAISTGVILTLLLLSFKGENMSLFVATSLLILAGFVGDDGFFSLLNVPNVDIFHYIIVGANIFLVRALAPR